MVEIKEVKKRKQKEKIIVKKVGSDYYVWTSGSIKKETEPNIILKYGEENKVKIGVDWVNRNIDKYIFISDKALANNDKEVDFERDCLFFSDLKKDKDYTWVRYNLENYRGLKDTYFVKDFCCGGRCGGSLNQEMELIKKLEGEHMPLKEV